MTEEAEPEVNYNESLVWTQKAERNGPNCFLCLRIAQQARLRKGRLSTLKIAGVVLSAESQLSHVARCAGGRVADA